MIMGVNSDQKKEVKNCISVAQLLSLHSGARALQVESLHRNRRSRKSQRKSCMSQLRPEAAKCINECL